MPNEFRVRRGQPNDLPAVNEIQQMAPEAARWQVMDYLTYEFYIAEVTFQKTEAAGFIAWREVTTGEWELLNMAVMPSFRRHGVGNQLLAELLQLQPASVFLEVRESNHGARAFYALHGFQPVGLRRNYYSSPTENAIVLSFQK